MNISSNKITFLVYNKLRKWVDFQRDKLRQQKNIALFDELRTAGICPACKGASVYHISDIPYSETFLNKWNGSVGDFYSIVPTEYLDISFPYAFCQECFLAFQSATISGFAARIENNPIINEKVLLAYEQQTQVDVTPELIKNLQSSNDNLSTIENHYRWLLDELGKIIIPGCSILDLGCNRGTFAELMRNVYPECAVWGCEINTTYATACKNRYPKINLIEEPLSESKKHGAFDVIFCSDVIEHIWDLDGFIKCIKNNLKPSGKIMFVTPNLMCASAIKNGVNWWGYMPPHHTQLFSSSALSMLLKRNGFNMLRTTVFGDELASVFELY